MSATILAFPRRAAAITRRRRRNSTENQRVEATLEEIGLLTEHLGSVLKILGEKAETLKELRVAR